ncbi:MAG TPA: SEC-C metal-binding domain-containing protein [Solirubrobacteraceae bacterium]|nr:SEC-C metal-binding domain-containing protein [Solirubrobacteraceae bacterium]
MAGPGRNDPCPCGSGRKLKRCCGEHRGPREDDLARAYLAHHARDAARRLRHLDDNELRELFDDLFELPELDLALTITLPQLITPDLQHLFDAVKADDPDAGDEVIPRILGQLDTPTERARLARTIINLRDTKRLDPLLAAAAIIDLDSRSRILLNASLVHAAFIHTGRLRTPGGLRLAA